jgi:regulator of protease activity HflC (stomatin/prohibitin superfamily)
MEISIALLVVVLVLVVLFLVSAIRIVPEYERLVLFRLGRCIGQKGPGLVLIIPLVDRPVRVDLRELFLAIPHQTCITKDNAPISIDFLVYWKVVDPALSVVKVQDFAGASQGIATTTLRAVVGDIPLDDVLAKREQINQVLRTKLDEVTERWGVKVTTVEIREIVPPKEVQEAMNKQMAAERNRRAMVTEADGRREAAVKVAEGDKLAVVLKAEGDKQAAVLRAEGFALALQKVFEVASTVDAKTMSLQYLDTLKALGAGPATKIVLPLEFTSLLRPLFERAS